MRINLSNTSYEVKIGSGILKNISQYFDFNRKVLIVCDDHLPSMYFNILIAQIPHAFHVVVPAGECAKSMTYFEKLSSFLLENQFTRQDLIIALGGGVISDLCGYVASNYMRGIAYITIPTTTLAMIDSSIGGKTAINFHGIKNILGAFHHPSLVIIDTDTLSTLPKRHYFSGLVEALKVALIYDAELYTLIKKGDFSNHLNTIIEKSLFIKKTIVEQDEKEQHLRKILNFGHTLGHALETSSDFSYYHGECVGLGMLKFIENPSLQSEVTNLLRSMEQPIEFSYAAEPLIDIIKKDKKSNGDTISIISVPKIGQYRIQSVSFDTLRNIILGVHVWNI